MGQATRRRSSAETRVAPVLLRRVHSVYEDQAFSFMAGNRPTKPAGLSAFRKHQPATDDSG